MERLKAAQFELGSLEAEAGVLVRAAEPYSVPPALKRNVRVRLVEAAPRRRVLPLLRVGIALGILGVVALAVAAVDRAWPRPAPHAVAKVAPSSLVSLKPALAEPSTRDPASAERKPASPSEVPDSVKHGSAESRADVHRSAAHDPGGASEASLVYDTARALRNEGDPARAARVLDDYFKRYPHGALAEEAQALAIDIAVARGDARAKGLASRYLEAYPSGHFRTKAERVLAAP